MELHKPSTRERSKLRSQRFSLSAVVFAALTLASASVSAQTDDFSSGDYSGGSGWTGDWTEIDDNNSSASGEILVTGGELFFDGGDSDGSQERIDRSLDLSAATSATLSFDWRCQDSSSGWESDDNFVVSVSTDGGSNFSQVSVLNGANICSSGSSSQSGTVSVSITAGSANTVIRFNHLADSSSEDMYIDNVEIVQGGSGGGGICGFGNSQASFDWSTSSGSGNEWLSSDDTDGDFRNYAINYTDVDGNPAIIGVTATLHDPDAANIDDNNTCPPPIGPSSCDPFPTKTNGIYGSGFLTLGMATRTSSESMGFDFSFSKSVFMRDFSVSDIDFIGYGDEPFDEPGDSYQDVVSLTASNGGTNVPLTLSAGSAMTVSGQTATANYVVDAFGDLNPNDSAGTVTVSSAGNLDSFSLIYSNGSADAAAEPTSNGVSDGHAVRLSGFSFCILNVVDYGDAPDSYKTKFEDDGARHVVTPFDSGAGTSGLMLGESIGRELDGQSSPAADGDGAEENGVGTLATNSVGGFNSATLPVAFINKSASAAAQLVCWIDWNQDGDFLDSDERSDPAISATGCANTADATDATFTTGNAAADCESTVTVHWTGIVALPTTGSNVYSRCRITTDTSFFSDSSPEPTGAVPDGEVEDDELPIPEPTAVTIGKISLESVSVAEYLTSADLNQLQALLVSYGVNTGDMARAALMAALTDILDPDGDGQVAVLRWDTLEERGTIGFYAERQNQEEGENWYRINNNLLPGLITAPMGAEYLLADPAAQSGRSYQYRLIELEATGNTRQYGPFTLRLR